MMPFQKKIHISMSDKTVIKCQDQSPNRHRIIIKVIGKPPKSKTKKNNLLNPYSIDPVE